MRIKEWKVLLGDMTKSMKTEVVNGNLTTFELMALEELARQLEKANSLLTSLLKPEQDIGHQFLQRTGPAAD